MHTRYSATRDETRRFLLANSNRTEDSFKSRLVKIGLGVVFVTGIATLSSIALHSGKPPISIMVNGSTAMKQNDGFCAVKCSKSGKGAFYSNDTVYVEDYSEKDKYWKKFYDRNENLLVEGRGNDSERWFFNPDHLGEPHFAKAVKMGDIWYTTEYDKGKKAVDKWKEVKVQF